MTQAALWEPRVSRTWAMPNGDTFSIAPIADFLDRWLDGSEIVIDPFARNSKRATVTNDLNPKSDAQFHMDAREFLAGCEVTADAVLFDPPYSPRQISELYQSIGRPVGTEDTQNARLYKSVRDLLDARLRPGGVALSFGWNSAGFGKSRSYELLEVLLVAHGGAHNDTICVAERKSMSDEAAGAKPPASSSGTRAALDLPPSVGVARGTGQGSHSRGVQAAAGSPLVGFARLQPTEAKNASVRTSDSRRSE